MNEWKEVTLGQVCDIKMEKSIKKNPYLCNNMVYCNQLK